jgi:hypothetical protein
LEEQRKADIRERDKLAASKSTRPSQVTEQNPVFQRMRVSLADAEAAVASLSAKLATYEEQYAQLKASARQVPEIEAEYTQLNRDYEILKTTYSNLLTRRQAAAMGANVQEQEDAMFRIVEPPRVSSEPVRPTRLMMLVLAFVAALGIGLLASFAANEIRPAFYDAQSLRTFAERPLLGTVSLRPTEAMRREGRFDRLLFLGGLAGLFASFAGVVAFGFLMTRAS